MVGLGDQGRGKLYKLTTNWTLSRTIFKDFFNTFEHLPLTASELFHTKDKYFWICLQNISWRISHFLKIQVNLWNIIAALSQVFFCHIFRTKDFRSFSKSFPSILTSHSEVTVQIYACFNRYIKWKVQFFDPIGCGNAIDTTNCCQMMS